MGVKIAEHKRPLNAGEDYEVEPPINGLQRDRRDPLNLKKSSFQEILDHSPIKLYPDGEAVTEERDEHIRQKRRQEDRKKLMFKRRHLFNEYIQDFADARPG